MLSHRILTCVGIVVAIMGLFMTGGMASTSLPLPATVRKVRVIGLNSVRASGRFGMMFSDEAGAFVAVPIEQVHNIRSAARQSIFLDIFGSPLHRRAATPIPADSVNIAVDSKRRVLYYVDHVTHELMEMVLVGGVPVGPGSVTGVSLRSLGIRDVRGIAVDSRNRQLIVLNLKGKQIVNVDLQFIEQGMDTNVLGNSDVVTTAIALDGHADLRGIAYDSTQGQIFVMRSDGQALLVASRDGTITGELDLSSVGLTTPQSVLFAPSGDLTDSERRMSLYVFDVGANGQRRMVEMAFTVPHLPRSAALSGDAVLVQVIDVSQLEPPSPDTAGAGYLSDVGRLVISDSEVNEMPIYEGVNAFEILMSGELIGGFNTLGFSEEPTGVAYKPNGQSLFFTDDNDDAVYEVGPGADGLYGTSDDIVSSFSTRSFDSHDPEGIAYEGVENRLFIVDGVNAEVYEISPGPNGIFDGVDDRVEHFDTEDLGILDPEGIEYNPDTDNLYIVGKPEELVLEVTTSGAPVQYIDISEPDPRKPAGLAYAPRSNDASLMSLYVVERGVDNDTDPDENDGKVYEFGLDIPATTPTATPTPPNTPTATATATSTPIPVTPTPTGDAAFNHAVYLAFVAAGADQTDQAHPDQVP